MNEILVSEFKKGNVYIKNDQPKKISVVLKIMFPNDMTAIGTAQFYKASINNPDYWTPVHCTQSNHSLVIEASKITEVNNKLIRYRS